MQELLLEGRPLAIVPCRNKKPACLHGFKDATADPTEIRELFQRYPGARQFGVPTGEINDLDVLDVDPRNGGNKFWEENQDRLPQTRIHQTPSGGHHLLFRHAPGLRCSTGRIAPGIDVKADGGFIIWWPLQHYPVLEASIAEWPDWLLELARAKQYRHKAAFSGGNGPLVTDGTPQLPKPLYDKLVVLMQGTRGHHQRRARGLLCTALFKPEGQQNHGLNYAAYHFRELIGIGAITYDAAETLLFEVASRNGYIARDGLCQATATIRSGLGPPATNGPSPSDEEETAS